MIFATIDISLSLTSTALQLKFVSVKSFVLLLGQLRDFLHSKSDFSTPLMNFYF